jgi:hypothetical protein
VVGTQSLPVGSDEADFLDRHGVEGSLPHRRDVIRAAAVDASGGKPVEHGDDLRDARLGKCDGALDRCIDFLGAAPIDQPAQPEIERNQGCAGEDNADDNHNDVLARESAQA